MTAAFRAARRLVALAATVSLLIAGALPAQAATPFTVQGQVLFPAGYDPADAVHTYVVLMPLSRSPWVRGTVGTDGRFSVTAPDAGNYTLEFYDSSKRLFDGGVTVDGHVSNNEPPRVFTSDTTITFTPRLTSSVRGRIEFPAGYGKDEGSFSIVAYRQHRDSWIGNGSLFEHEIEDDGSFEFRGLVEGTVYRLELRDSSGTLLSGYHGGDAYVESIEDAVSVVAPASGVDFRPSVASTLSGRLVAPAGVDIAALAADRGLTVGHAEAPSTSPEFRHSRRTSVGTDGTFTLRGLWPDKPLYLAAWSESEAVEGGLLDATGALTLDLGRARTVLSGTGDHTIHLQRPTQFSGSVELPAGFSYDPANPPRVRTLPSTDEYSFLRWSSSASVPVAADGSFTTARTHSQTDFRLLLTWPDGREVYWTSNHTVPTPDADAAATTRPRGDVVFPASNRMVNLTAPRISGDARVGARLRADAGTWTAPSPTLTYQWLRAGTPIPGATQQTYRLTAADAGSRIAVRVTARRAGYPSASATSPQSTVVARGELAPLTRPKVSGTARLGKTLKATVTAPAGASLDYQWLRGGKPVKGATSRTYRLTKKDRGKKLSVRVTATRAGYLPRSATSQKTSKIAKAVPKVKVKTTKKISRTTRPKVTVRVTTPLTTKPTGKVRITYGKRTRTVQLKARHKGKITVRLPRLTQGKHKIRARYTPDTKHKRYLKPTKSKKLTVRVR